MAEDQKFHVTLAGDGVQVAKDVSDYVARRILNIVLGGESGIPAPGEERDDLESAAGRGGPPDQAGAKAFIAAKKPRTDVERVTCLAYYLTHTLNSPTFRTRDISKLNGEAHQPRLANPTVAVNNASRQRYLTPAGGGKKRITAFGEELVRALPDREAVRAVLAAQPTRRRKKGSGSKAKRG